MNDDTDNVITVVITGVNKHYDGEHELNLARLKAKQTHEIKRLSGLRPTEYGDAFATGDPDFAIGLAAAALVGKGIQVVDAILWDVEPGQISLRVPDDEGDALPPAPTSSPDEPQSNDGQSEKNGSSGDAS